MHGVQSLLLPLFRDLCVRVSVSVTCAITVVNSSVAWWCSG